MTGVPAALPAEAGRDSRSANPQSLAVLPFVNLSGDPGQEYFSDGFSEDLITELSRFHQIFVLSRNASFALKGRRLDVRDLGRHLGTSYCLEGSVRNLGSRVRITSRLVDTRSGDQVWAEKYDCKLEELFDVQDDLAASIVSMVAGRIEHEARVAAKRKKPSDMLAHDCLMRGLEHHRLGGVTRETAEQALHWFEKAIERILRLLAPTLGAHAHAQIWPSGQERTFGTRHWRAPVAAWRSMTTTPSATGSLAQ